MDAKQIIERFRMQPNDEEGGYYADNYTSSLVLDNQCLPGFKPVKGGRPLCGAIYYLIDAQDFSAMHRVTGDMLYHFYDGYPVQMLLLYPDGHSEVCTFSNDLSKDGKPMKVIPGGTWLGSHMLPGGDYAFMGVSMAPGFNPADYEIGQRAELIKEYPTQKKLIEQLTRS